MNKKKKLTEEIDKHKKTSKSSAEVAEVLRLLTDEISHSVLTVSGEKLPLDDVFTFSMKKQLKKGVVSCDFVFQAKISGEIDNIAVGEEKAIKVKRFKASGGKKLKKDISRLWKDVSKNISAGLPPSPEIAKELLKICDDYSLHAHSEWFDLWRNCCSEVKSCVNSALSGDFITAVAKINEVNRLTRECHKLYK